MSSSEIWRKCVGHVSSKKKDCEVGVTCVWEQREAGQNVGGGITEAHKSRPCKASWVVEKPEGLSREGWDLMCLKLLCED